MALDKIKSLLAKSGVSKELATQIVESMEEYKATVVAESQQELAAKVKAAKTVVLEEVESYKTDLARRVQLFCESKSQTIEQQLMRKSAAGETEAKAKLTKVYALLEGINLNGKPNSQLTAQLADAKNQLGRLGKQLQATKAQAERSARIAESVMEKNQKLIKENKNLQGGKLIQEGKDTKATATEPGIVVPARKRAVTEQVVTESALAPKTNNTTTNPIDAIAARMR